MVVANKSYGLGVLYFVTTLILGVSMSIAYETPGLVLIVLMFLISLFLFISITISKRDLIIIEGNNLIINKRVPIAVPLNNVVEVVQKNYHGRGIRYTAGRIIIKTGDGNQYTVRYVADVDRVKSEILKFVYTMEVK